MDLNRLHFLQFDTIYNIPEKAIREGTVEQQKTAKKPFIEPTEGPAPSEEKQVHFSGDGEAQVFVLVEDTKNPVLNQEDETFLFKIMGAVKHSKSSVVLINVANQDKTLVRDFLENAKPEIIIAFGVLPAYYTMQSAIAAYEAYIENDIKFFPAADLSSIRENTGQKKKLWEGLQLLFNLKKQP